MVSLNGTLHRYVYEPLVLMPPMVTPGLWTRARLDFYLTPFLLKSGPSPIRTRFSVSQNSARLSSAPVPRKSQLWARQDEPDSLYAHLQSLELYL